MWSSVPVHEFFKSDLDAAQHAREDTRKDGHTQRFRQLGAGLARQRRLLCADERKAGSNTLLTSLFI
jgi:hypothetical protein